MIFIEILVFLFYISQTKTCNKKKIQTKGSERKKEIFVKKFKINAKSKINVEWKSLRNKRRDTNQRFILKTIKEIPYISLQTRRIFAASCSLLYLSVSLSLFFFINISSTSADVAEPHLGGSARTWRVRNLKTCGGLGVEGGSADERGGHGRKWIFSEQTNPRVHSTRLPTHNAKHPSALKRMLKDSRTWQWQPRWFAVAAIIAS